MGVNYFKELAHIIVEAGKTQICKIGQQAGDSGKRDVVAGIQR